MKKLYLICITVCTILIACNNNSNNSTAKKVFKRNTSITTANAYNDLFLDSASLEDFIVQQNIDGGEANRIRAFYYDRNFEYAWFATDGINEQGRGFWNLVSYSVSSLKDSSAFSKVLNKRMPDITSADSLTISASDTSFAKTELLLTEAFMRYTNANSDVESNNELTQYVPGKKDNVMQAANNILKSNDEPGLNKDAEAAYKQLKNQLKKYYDIANKGGWPNITFTQKKYKQGSSAAVIPLIKKRLSITGEYQGTDSSATFDNLLDTAIKSYQISMGYTPDGIITDSLIKDMDVTAVKRVEQLLINLYRLKWMPEAVQGRLIIANIPEYELHVYDDKKKVFDMDVVVGKDGAGTVIFTGNLTEIVFSPYWNIPPSIVRKEIVPKMDADKDYMARERLEITGHSNGLPIVRQLPGPKNSLGRVKFLFHNSYNIYFHDTPEKGLFNKDKRAYSHGCIRLADPVKMADYLLDDSQKWTPEKINEAMNSGKEKYVDLKKSVAVIITYYTAWVDENNRLNFRDDIYHHDADMAAKMFTDAE